MHRSLFIFILMVSISGFQNLHAQEGHELGFRIGSGVYFGDLNTDYSLSNMGLAFGVVARRNVNERISFTGAIDYTRIGAKDSNGRSFFQRTRNLSFKSNVFDFNLTMEFNFFKYIHGSDEYYYTPYIFGGFSVMKYNPTAELNGETYSLRSMGTEGQINGQEYGLVSGAFVFGAGFKWDINRDWSLNASISGRNIFSDYIDDVSGTYPDFLVLQSRRGDIAVQLSDRSMDPDFARQGMQRGNGKNNDLIYFFNIGIMRYFGELPCPAISKNVY